MSLPPDKSAAPLAVTQSDCERSLDIYRLCRAKIEHEDELVNQRLTWLITLQGLLFTAYGFSISAEAASLGSKGIEIGASEAARHSYDAFMKNLFSLRHGLSYLGIAIAFAALTGILAACRAIRDDVSVMHGLPVKDLAGKPLFPGIVNEGSANALGMTCALSVPFMLASVWIWAGELGGRYTWTGLALAAVVTLTFVFFRISKTGRAMLSEPRSAS